MHRYSSKYDKAQCEFQATLKEGMGRKASLRELQVIGRQDKEEGICFILKWDVMCMG